MVINFRVPLKEIKENMSRHMKKGKYGSSNEPFPIGATECILPETSSWYLYSKDSGETALMHRLARAFAGHLCDKYPFPMG